jgi:hypothetical protein
MITKDIERGADAYTLCDPRVEKAAVAKFFDGYELAIGSCYFGVEEDSVLVESLTLGILADDSSRQQERSPRRANWMYLCRVGKRYIQPL